MVGGAMRGSTKPRTTSQSFVPTIPDSRPDLLTPHHFERMDTNIAALLRDVESGDGTVADRLFAALYDDLHRLAERQLGRNGGHLTLGTTTLLHEAYINIAGRSGPSFPDRAHFMAYAARAMRGLIIDYCRNHRAQKRGGEFHITAIDDAMPIASAEPDSVNQLEELGEALEGLSRLDPPLAELVDLHFFCGFGFGEIASMRGVSERTVQRDWRKARLLLHRVMQDDPADAGSDRGAEEIDR